MKSYIPKSLNCCLIMNGKIALSVRVSFIVTMIALIFLAKFTAIIVLSTVDDMTLATLCRRHNCLSVWYDKARCNISNTLLSEHFLFNYDEVCMRGCHRKCAQTVGLVPQAHLALSQRFTSLYSTSWGYCEQFHQTSDTWSRNRRNRRDQPNQWQFRWAKTP